MSVYDSKDLLTFKGAAREYDVPKVTLEMAAAKGALRVIEASGEHLLLRADVEQFVKRTIKRGLGSTVVSRINR
jgi:hypothetical protein